MSEQNPYIVREEEGKAATIRDFVTGIPLKPDEMLPDEHGIFPVSPLGFLNKESGDGSVQALGVHGNTTGFMPYKVDDNPEQAYRKSYVIDGKYYVYTGKYVAFPVLSLTKTSTYELTATVLGNVAPREENRVFFVNTTADDYTGTGLVSETPGSVSWGITSIVPDGDKSIVTISIYRKIAFNGIVGAGKLNMCISPPLSNDGFLIKPYVCIHGNDDPEMDGIYLPGSSDDDVFRKVYAYDALFPEVPGVSFDMLVAVNSLVDNYIEVALTDGTFQPIHNDCENLDFFYMYKGVDCNVKSFNHVATDTNGNPIFRTYCYSDSKDEWYGPYLSTWHNADGTKRVADIYRYVAGEPAIPTIASPDHREQQPPESEEFEPLKCKDVATDCYPLTVQEGSIYYEMSDAASYDGSAPGDNNDIYLYCYNIRNEETECYASNGYNDKEVASWVSGKLAPVIGYASHPQSEVGNLDKAGAFARWFASCSDVDVSGGIGKSQVVVPGFGLGAGYIGSCISGRLGGPDVNGLVSGGLLTFGCGTKHGDSTVLPLDWPFTSQNIVSDESENNITLVRDGVSDNGAVLGALAKYDECNTCGGSGEVGGEACPDCCGTGYARTGTVNNKIHVCLYNDFTPSDDESGPYVGTTVLKKTFINLGAPLDTDDGDEMEVTVSLPNVNVDAAFPISGDTGKNQSGYYAFISQPRVYVVSGTWKFSDTKVNVDTASSSAVSIKVDHEFLDDAGNALGNVRIRFTVRSVGYPVDETTLTGTISGTTITLDGCNTVSFRSNTKYTICGAAYLDDNNGTLPEGSTPIGLNAVRIEKDGGVLAGELGPDYGTGSGIQVYNRMYGASDSDTGREQVIEQSDKRQIVATVYPTVTNTFAWELSGRKTLSHLESIMTMAAEDGASSIMARVAEMNRSILMSHQAFVDAAGGDFGLGPKYYPVSLSAVGEAHSEGGDGYSYIARVIQVAEQISADEGTLPPESNPVRQAIRAVNMMASDYRNARAYTGALEIGTNDTFMAEPRVVGSGWGGMFDVSDYSVIDAQHGTDDVTARTIRMRNLANIVSQSASGNDRTPVSPMLGLAPYVWPDGTKSEFHTGNPYGYTEYDTTDAMTETRCDFVNNTYGTNFAAENSIFRALLRKSPSWLDSTDAVNDLVRAVELAAVDLGDDVLKVYRETSTGDRWRSVFNPFAGIVSPDNIPVPTGEPSYGSDLGDTATWYGGDAYSYYRLRKGYGTGSTNPPWLIATTMDPEAPELPSLASFLANYVPSYGADLPMRNWDSFRVRVKKSMQDTADPVYLTRMGWYGRTCSNILRGQYAADAFIGSTEYQDVNLNRLSVEDTVAHNYSSTPYALGGTFDPTRGMTHVPFNSASDRGAVAYIRVFMKFTFSADAGRWYCTDYRQAPVSYLTPLYGAGALEETIDDRRIWGTSACGEPGWKAVTRMLYDDYAPLDIDSGLVSAVMSRPGGTGVSRLMTPFMPVNDGGIGLNTPKDRAGTSGYVSESEPHCNFWSVRTNLRPAVGALPGTDIPRYSKDGTSWVHSASGGIMADPVLWGQYDYPRKREVEYHLPSVADPETDTVT